jgi:thiol-disulfide isomerase/thioredoxin
MTTDQNLDRYGNPCGPVLIILACFSLLGINPESASAFHETSDREVMEGAILQKRSLETFDGQSLNAPSEEGLTVILFWAMWSPRSRQALELWQKFDNEYSDHPLKIITVNVEHQDLQQSEREQIIQFVEDMGINLPLVIDEELNLFNEFGVKAVPTAFFLNNEGFLLLRYASFPSSAPLDLQEEVEINLGLKKRETEEEKEKRGKLAYQPKNNALLYYNLGVQLQKKGMKGKALVRYITALQLDPEYNDPLRTLEGIFSPDGRTPEGEEELKSLLIQNDLEDLVEKIGEGPPIVIDRSKKLNAMERMHLLMEKNTSQPAQTTLPSATEPKQAGSSSPVQGSEQTPP